MILFLHQVALEGPGTMAPYLSERGLPFRRVRLFEGEPVPHLDEVTCLVILGGPMGVYQEKQFPFLRNECRLLEGAIWKGIPVLGVCFGAQLVAKVLVAKSVKAPVNEVGWYDAALTYEGFRDPLFEGSRSNLRVFQCHEDTFDLPQEAILLARGETCYNQAFRYGKRVCAIQFHVEIDGEMIDRWFEDYEPENPTRQNALAEYQRIAADFHQQARQFYDNFFLFIPEEEVNGRDQTGIGPSEQHGW